MEPVEDTKYNATERMIEYDDQMWKETFKRHGIPEKYYSKWFANFQHSHDEILSGNFDTIVKNCRRNIPIALIGEIGNGKTHLACAILKDAIICSLNSSTRYEKDQNGRYLPPVKVGHYYTMTSLNREFREALQTGSGAETKFMDEMARMNCLVIDEIQINSNSESQQRMFREIIDSRYANKKQTIFCGNVSGAEFAEFMGEALIDRLREQSLECLVFSSPSYRGRND